MTSQQNQCARLGGPHQESEETYGKQKNGLRYESRPPLLSSVSSTTVNSCLHSRVSLDSARLGERKFLNHDDRIVHLANPLLDSDRGRLLTFATPEDIKDLQEGDQLTVCVADADPTEALPHDSPVN
jgi:hypothetical protein